MADLQNYALTFPGSTQNLTAMPRITVSARVTDSSTGALIADFTGANSFDLLPEIKNRTAAQQLQIADAIAVMMIYMKAGING